MSKVWTRCALLAAAAMDAVALAAAAAPDTGAGDWQPLFDGESLAGWTAKIRGYELGDNFADAFRVRDGKLVVVAYDSFDGRFGHLFYEAPFSYCRLHIEYRFVGEQALGGPGDWAVRNSGVMVYALAPQTMTVDQAFPVSVEALEAGWSALQSESHPIEFRRVEIMNLAGCLDPAAANYRPEIVRARPGACTYSEDAGAPLSAPQERQR